MLEFSGGCLSCACGYKYARKKLEIDAAIPLPEASKQKKKMPFYSIAKMKDYRLSKADIEQQFSAYTLSWAESPKVDASLKLE